MIEDYEEMSDFLERMEAPGGALRENIDRTEEALSTKVKMIATGCPFCNTMITDGVKLLAEGAVEVLDIAELIVKSEQL